MFEQRPMADGSAPGEGLAGHPYSAVLARVQKPGRYLGGERQQVRKDPSGLACRFVLAFPDLYEVGMSHLGTRILYDLVNRAPDLACERAFTPWTDMEAQLRLHGLPLVSLENGTPLAQFDVVGVSLQYELSYTNVLLNLDLGGIPLRSADRGDSDPIVLAGGPTATHPEPLADFIDAFVVGEAEEVLCDLLRTIGELRRQGEPRDRVLAKIAALPGVYVPAMYAVEADPRTGLEVVVGRTEAGIAANAPERVERVWVRDLDQFPFPDSFPEPYAEAIFDRAAVEIARGCTEGCRFCQAGIIYRPVRERDPQQVIETVLAGVDRAGYDETSLTALSTADVSCIDPLIRDLVPRLVERDIKLGVASLRAYGLGEELLDEVKRVGISGLTFAPEAGTQRMRDVINKNVSDADIMASARRIFERGYDRMKLYFIMGLPTETDEDVVGIAETAARVRGVARELQLKRMPNITASVSQHVPKPHTPFQWAAMDALEDLETKARMLRGLCKRYKVALKTHDVRQSWLECLFARGDRRLGRALEAAYRAGVRFDGWSECFDFDRWLDALEGAGIDPPRYTRTLPVDARLPWDHIDIGMEPGFLAAEYRKALASRLSPPCGKPFGAQVHNTTLADARGDHRRLVCYDCGVACDMTQMRDERIDMLRTLSGMSRERVVEEAAEGTSVDPSIVAADRLVGRLAPSKLDEGSAFKRAAEAPFSRLRLFFAKGNVARFLGHRDLMRIFPRWLRRAGIQLGFTRGYNPTPRMTFAPAMPLGMAADEECVDVDVLLSVSHRDMTGLLSSPERDAAAAAVLDALRRAAPPGLEPIAARLVGHDEERLGRLIVGADYVVDFGHADLEAVAARVRQRLGEPTLPVERPVHGKRRRRGGRRAGETTRQIDVRPVVLSAVVDSARGELRFRVAINPEGGGARPREIVEALTGARIPDDGFRRARLLAHDGEGLVGLRERGAAPRTKRARGVSDPIAADARTAAASPASWP